MGMQWGHLRSVLFLLLLTNQDSSHVVTSSCEKIFSDFRYKKEHQHICSACSLEHRLQVVVSLVRLVVRWVQLHKPYNAAICQLPLQALSFAT